MKCISRRNFVRTAIAATAMQQMTHLSRAAAIYLGSISLSGDDLAFLTLSETSELIRQQKITSTQLVAACLERIKIYNPKLDAYITVMGQSALAQAKELDEEQKAGKVRGPLHGIPIAIKDNIDTDGTRTTAASAVYDDRVPAEDAEVVRRLKAAGAILIAKANMDEFAFGVSYFGSARNPWNLERDTGGSSSGPAVATAAGLCYGALGTDTSCSIRMPASYCGVVGLKPTYGLVSIRGIVPDILSLDHCGPLTRSAEDAAILLGAIAGYDRLDIASVMHTSEDYVAAAKQPVSNFRIGIPRAPFFDHVDPEVLRVIEDAIGVITKLVSNTKEAILPSSSGIVLHQELFAAQEDLFKTNESKYMLSTRGTLQSLAQDPKSGCVSQMDTYIKSRWKLELLRRTIDDSFSKYDLVVLPTMRHVPRKLDTIIRMEEDPKPGNPEGDPYRDCAENNMPFNLYGIPAISIPCGFTAGQLPVGLMIAGPRFSEGKILALARAYEKETQWAKIKPPLSPDMPVPPLPAREDKR